MGLILHFTFLFLSLKLVSTSCLKCSCLPKEKWIKCYGEGIHDLHFSEYWKREVRRLTLINTNVYSLPDLNTFLKLEIVILSRNRLLICDDIHPYSQIIFIHDMECLGNEMKNNDGGDRIENSTPSLFSLSPKSENISTWNGTYTGSDQYQKNGVENVTTAVTSTFKIGMNSGTTKLMENSTQNSGYVKLNGNMTIMDVNSVSDLSNESDIIHYFHFNSEWRKHGR